jgi:hypothetical protein
MKHQESNHAIAAPKVVKATVAARSRARRESQRVLTEIGAHAPARPQNDLAPQLGLEARLSETGETSRRCEPGVLTARALGPRPTSMTPIRSVKREDDHEQA